MSISILSKNELKAAKLLFRLIESMGKLGPSSRAKVYERWHSIRLMLGDDCSRFEANILRVCDDSGKDRRFK